MQQEQISRVDTAQEYSPDPVDVFMDRLTNRLTPPLAQQVAAMRTKPLGTSWIQVMLSLIDLGCLA